MEPMLSFLEKFTLSSGLDSTQQAIKHHRQTVHFHWKEAQPICLKFSHANPLLDVVKDVCEPMRSIDNLLIDLVICITYQYLGTVHISCLIKAKEGYIPQSAGSPHSVEPKTRSPYPYKLTHISMPLSHNYYAPASSLQGQQPPENESIKHT